MYPPLYLTTEEYEIDGSTVLYVNVPVGKTVYRNAGRIFDRNNESDIDITDNADMVFNLYARKQSTYFVNKVYPAIPVSSLRHDLMDRARRMTRINNEHHPWVDMTDDHNRKCQPCTWTRKPESENIQAIRKEFADSKGFPRDWTC